MIHIPKAAFGLIKEVARHLLRRPVVGFVAYATTPDGHLVLIRRGDTGLWALPGGTLEWGETLRDALGRELKEEAGVELTRAGELLGVYSDPSRDPRFHAVTIAVSAAVDHPSAPPMNPLEILEVGLFAPDALPDHLSHGLGDVVRRGATSPPYWE